MKAAPERFEQGPAEGTTPQSYTSFVAVAWRHKALIALGAAVGIVIGMLYYSRQPAIYQSNASLMVIKRGNQLPGVTDDRGSFIYDYLDDQQIIMKSPVVLTRAALDPRIKDLKYIGKVRNPAASMINSISIVREPGRDATSISNVLNLAFVSPEPEDCRVVLEVVIDAYKAFLNETYKNATEENLKQLYNLSKELKKDMEKGYEAIATFREQAIKENDGKDLPLPATDGRTPEESALTALKQQMFAAKSKKDLLEERKKALQEALAEGAQQARAAWLSQILNDKTILLPAGADGQARMQSLNERIFQNDVAKDRLRSKGFGKNHPEVLQLERENKLIRDLGMGKSDDGEDSKSASDPIKDYITALDRDLWHVNVEISSLSKQLAVESKEASKIAKYMKDERDLQKKLDFTAQMILPVESASRQAQMTLNQDNGFDAHVIAPPLPGNQIAPSQSRIMMTAAFLGLCGGFGLAYLVEVMDKSFRTPDEIRRRLGCTVIGHIPVIVTDQAPVEASPDGRPVLDPRLCTYYQSKSFHSEAFRGLRTALYFSTQGEVHKVIQITSPQASDGKSTLVANLAVSIAQSGRKVVLIDADLRKPRLHKMFGLSSNVGLASIISQEVEIKDAIQPTQVPGLSIIPCGPRPSNPAELLTSPVFKEFLDTIREEFDYVLIDTPPLLAVSDPSVVAPRVDGVILAIRVSKNGRPNAERAKEILNTLGANVLGVVVNGAGPRGGQAGYGYGYDSYRYNYGYAYNYSYDYSYSYDTYSSYYDDDEEGEGGAAKKSSELTTQTDEAPAPAPPVHRSSRAKHRNGNTDSGFLSRFWKRRG